MRRGGGGGGRFDGEGVCPSKWLLRPRREQRADGIEEGGPGGDGRIEAAREHDVEHRGIVGREAEKSAPTALKCGSAV